MRNYVFRLFVTGGSARSEDALKNLRRICEEHVAGQYDLSVIDVLEHPQQAEALKILATPTLIKDGPPPPRRLIGDLSAYMEVVDGLDLQPKAPNTE
ncbi:MAG: circadian clock KaiB family protein [Rhodothermales bacterium]|nr:circadian clock KaiB family protein [Rhodothermales bacterium]